MKGTSNETIESLKTQNADQYKRINALEITLATVIAKVGLEPCGTPTGNGLSGDLKDLEKKVDSLKTLIEETAKKNTRNTIYAVIACLILGSLAPAFIMEVVERFMGVFT